MLHNLASAPAPATHPTLQLGAVTMLVSAGRRTVAVWSTCPTQAARAVEHDVGRNQISEASTRRTEPIELVGQHCRKRRANEVDACCDGRRALDRSAGQIDFQPAHHFAALPVGARLEASDKALRFDARPKDWCDGRRRSVDKVVERISAPAVTGVAAEIESAPAPGACRGRLDRHDARPAA